MPRIASLLCLLSVAASGCWADFPPELLHADGPADGHGDRPRDLGPDHPLDGPRPDRPADGPRPDRPPDGPAPDRPGDGPASDRDATSSDAAADLGASDAISEAPLLLPLGTPCTAAGKCASNLCDPRSKLCCNAPCAGTCMTCALAGQEGRCSFVPAAVDPHGDCAADPLASCKLDGTCDGKGSCRNYPAGTTVAAAACTGVMSEKVQLATVCDGSGAPIPGAEVSCDPYTCDPGTRRCRGSCSGAGDCATGLCLAGRCDGKYRSPGAACAKDQDCASKSCVDGVCCENLCGMPCHRCNLAGLEGKCTPAFAGSDPDGECTATPGLCGGLDGQCDGVGACRARPDGMLCAPASCTASILTVLGTCAGSTCVETTTSCGSHACLPAGDGCYALCSKDAHCKPGCTCNTSSWSCEGSC